MVIGQARRYASGDEARHPGPRAWRLPPPVADRACTCQPSARLDCDGTVPVCATMLRAEALSSGTVILTLPIVVWAFTPYRTSPGTCRLTEPTVVTALIKSGAAENVTSMLPTLELRVARDADMSSPSVEPA